MRMSDLVLRLINGWYDPRDQSRREHRTSVARHQAIVVRLRAEKTAARIESIQYCYRQADGTLCRSQREPTDADD